MRVLTLVVGLIISTNVWALTAPLGEVSQIHQSPEAMFSKWRSMLDRQTTEGGVGCDVSAIRCLPVDVIEKLEPVASHDLMNKIAAVNQLVNRVSYRSDKRQYGASDYWASPLEFFSNGKGDCEDYGIAKYFALRALGVEPSNMRLIIAKDSKTNDFHAVLSVKVGNNYYILDNRSNSIKVDLKFQDLLPIYALNESQWWLYEGAMNVLKG